MPKRPAGKKTSDPLTDLREHHRALLHRAEYELLFPALQANEGSERGAARDLGIAPHSRVQAAVLCNPLLREAKRRGKFNAKPAPPVQGGGDMKSTTPGRTGSV